ncbi:MAG: hypothetical protein LBG69_02165 [Zoogloeaceae bacterium]|jgi:hypothetical protein|nr:hypothetical protein [Zoogloeaceae bacterium]
MNENLIESWAEHYDAFTQVLTGAERRICVLDDDLTRLGLHQPENVEILRLLLLNHFGVSVRFALRDASHLRETHPRLMPLLRTYGHLFHIRVFPDLFAETRESFFLADSERALVRFDLELPRGKLVWDNAREAAPYHLRFEEIWEMPAQIFLPDTLGL